MTTEHVQKSELQKIRQLEAETSEAIKKGQKKKAIRLLGKAEQLFKKGGSATRDDLKHVYPAVIAKAGN